MSDNSDKDDSLCLVIQLVQRAMKKKHRKSSAVVSACNQLAAGVVAVASPDDPYLNADLRVIMPDTKPTASDRFWLSVGTSCCPSFGDALAAFAAQKCCPRDIQPLETRYVLSTLMWRTNSHLCSAAQIARAFFGDLRSMFATCDGKRFASTPSCMIPRQLLQAAHNHNAVDGCAADSEPRMQHQRAAHPNRSKSKSRSKSNQSKTHPNYYSKLPVVVRVTKDLINLPRRNLFTTHGELLVCAWTQTAAPCSSSSSSMQEEQAVRGVCLVKQNAVSSSSGGAATGPSIVFSCTTSVRSINSTCATQSRAMGNAEDNVEQAVVEDDDGVCVRTTSDFKHAVVNHRQACGTDAYAVVLVPSKQSSNQPNNQASKQSSQQSGSIGSREESRSVVLCFRFASIEACGEAGGVLVRNNFGPHVFVALCDLDAGIVGKASAHSRVCSEFCSGVVSDYADLACGAQVHLPSDVSFVVSQRDFAIAAWPQKLGMIERQVVDGVARWQLSSLFALRPHDRSDMQDTCGLSQSQRLKQQQQQQRKQWLEGWPCPNSGLIYVSSDTHTYAIQRERHVFKFVRCGPRTPKPEAIMFLNTAAPATLNATSNATVQKATTYAR